MRRQLGAWFLDRADKQLIEEIYKSVWNEAGDIENPALWFYAILDFLQNRGYEIKEIGDDCNCRRQSQFKKYIEARRFGKND